MKLAGLLGGLILVALIAPFLLPKPPPPSSPAHLPWNIEVLPEGRSRVFGLTLPQSTLDEARALHGPDLELGLIMEHDRALALEAYQASANLGFTTGKLILTLAVPAAELTAIAGRATDAKPLPSGAHRLALAPEDARAAGRWPVSGVAFIPSIDLDEQTVLARFGEPAERIPAGPGRSHLLYPSRGLDLLLDAEGRELLQYVAPSAFEALVAPLRSGAPAPSAQ